VKGEMGKEFNMPVDNKTREKLNIPPSFPSEAVISAYLNPSVDTVDASIERFSWTVLNLGLRKFAMDRFRWDKSQVEKYLNSSRLMLSDKGLLASSKRVEEAIRKVRGLKSPEKLKTDKNIWSGWASC
jgi:hypothetical protein